MVSELYFSQCPILPHLVFWNLRWGITIITQLISKDQTLITIIRKPKTRRSNQIFSTSFWIKLSCIKYNKTQVFSHWQFSRQWILYLRYDLTNPNPGGQWQSEWWWPKIKENPTNCKETIMADQRFSDKNITDDYFSQ